MTSRREFLQIAAAPALQAQGRGKRPNILFAMSDDQSWRHTSSGGDPVVKTPHIDHVAGSGVRFTQAFCPAPGCAPSRAALFTGRNIWQLEEAGTHASLFPKKFAVYPSLLAAAGYFVGLTGKGAGPCNWQDAGWKHNPAGPAFDQRKVAHPLKMVNANDYAANFADFLAQKPRDRPFCFWFGSTEPHRGYVEGSGVRSGMKLDRLAVPPFLPDAPEVRGDLADYLWEVQYFDQQLGRILRHLEKAGELSNTLIVVTGDNGMSFPRAKANLYEYGIHAPLAIAWPDRFRGGRVVDDLVSFIDFAPTFLEAAGLPVPGEMTGRSLLPMLESNKSGTVDRSFDRIVSGRERHSHARFDNLGYPCRAVRTADYLYIRNFKPDLWPAGDPEIFADVDNGPAKSYMLAHRDDPLFDLAFGKRPEEELYDIRRDPGCLKNLAGSNEHAPARRDLRASLELTLTMQKDPRMLGTGDIFDSYPRYSAMRPQLGGFAERGAYNPKYRRR